MVIFVALGFIYSIIYSGTFTTDDEHILASQSLSIAFDSHFNIGRVLGNSRIFTFSQLPSQQAMEAANIEPALSWLGALMAKLSVLLGTGHVQSLFLLNIWITALTGMVLFIITQDMGYSRLVGFILAGFYGLGTIALPYSKTYFRDPLAALLLLCAWMFAYRIRTGRNKSDNKNEGLISWFGFVLFSIASILAKNTVVIAIPVMLLIIFGQVENKTIEKNPKGNWRIWVLSSCSFAGLLLIWFFIVPRIQSLARFTPQYYASLVKYFISSPRPNIVQALTGPFISPGKSIFLFSPILVFSAASLFLHFKSSWFAWLYLLLLVVFQALFYDVAWAGHVNWGLRFTLPAIPLLILAAAPIVERLSKSRLGKVLIGVIAVSSISVQLLGALVPVKQYFIDKGAAGLPVGESAITWQGSQSILLWSIQRVFSGSPPDNAAWRNPLGLSVILAGLLIIGGLVFYALQKNNRYWVAGPMVGILILMDIVLPGFYINDSAYFKTREDFEFSNQFLADNIKTGDVVLIKSYGSPDWSYWMNWGTARIQWVSMPFTFPTLDQMRIFNQSGQAQDALDPISLKILGAAHTSGIRVWLLSASDSPGNSLGLEQSWLKERSKTHECKIFAGEKNSSVLCIYEFK